MNDANSSTLLERMKSWVGLNNVIKTILIKTKALFKKSQRSNLSLCEILTIQTALLSQTIKLHCSYGSLGA